MSYSSSNSSSNSVSSRLGCSDNIGLLQNDTKKLRQFQFMIPELAYREMNN